jgi:hypothetical protein
MSDLSNDVAAALDNRDITDDEGQISEEETSVEESATQEENTEDESVTAEKPAEDETSDSESEDEPTETQLAEDDSGKRYVPEKRFKEVYADLKQTQRDLKARDSLIQELMSKGMTQKQAEKEADKSQPEVQPPNKADVLELRMTLPQFDPKAGEDGKPSNPDYSEALDKLGYQIWRANPGMSPLEAGRQALKTAKDISKAELKASSKAREVKSNASDQGITSRVTSRQAEKFDAEKATDQEIEEYLRSTGQW